MPELPEVETVRRQLAAALIGKTFRAVRQVEPAMLRDCDADQLRASLPGRRVNTVKRLGKFLVIELSGRVFLTLHLGMTGQLLVNPGEDETCTSLPPSLPADTHTRFVFDLSGGEYPVRLEFRDIRKFGRLHLTVDSPAVRLRELGPDAWQGSWDVSYLVERLRGRTAPVKAFLLDQRHLAGIGNIYADEILWWTGVSPLRACGSLSLAEVTLLASEIRKRLGEGVRLLGCTVADFVGTDGKPGGFQNWLQAYGRHGQPCSRCGVALVRVLIAGRGTAYCPNCQH